MFRNADETLIEIRRIPTGPDRKNFSAPRIVTDQRRESGRTGGDAINLVIRSEDNVRMQRKTGIDFVVGPRSDVQKTQFLNFFEFLKIFFVKVEKNFSTVTLFVVLVLM